jgi:NAD(P)-dependent dehydrogenase (short-subunit alcohol dehydrogenase family)
MPSLMVTGASSGIGWACVASAVQHGWHAYAGVRTSADAERLRHHFGDNVTPLILDVCQAETITAAAQLVRTQLAGQTLNGLVNNAGVAVAGPMLHIPLDEVRQQFEINFFGQIAVTQAFAPLLGTDATLAGSHGRIINISSLGGKLGAPYLAPYVSSKHALEGWSECLRRELLMYGIDVIIVGPGAIATPIWTKAEQLNVAQYADTDYAPYITRYHQKLIAKGVHGLPAERVGALIMHALTTSRPKTRYALAPNILMDWWLPRLLPKRWIDRLAAKSYGLPDSPVD